MKRVVDFEFRFRADTTSPVQDERFGYRRVIVSLIPSDRRFRIYDVPIAELYHHSGELIYHHHWKYVMADITNDVSGKNLDTSVETVELRLGENNLDDVKEDLKDVLMLAIISAERVSPQF